MRQRNNFLVELKDDSYKKELREIEKYGYHDEISSDIYQDMAYIFAFPLKTDQEMGFDIKERHAEYIWQIIHNEYRKQKVLGNFSILFDRQDIPYIFTKTFNGNHLFFKIKSLNEVDVFLNYSKSFIDFIIEDSVGPIITMRDSYIDNYLAKTEMMAYEHSRGNDISLNDIRLASERNIFQQWNFRFYYFEKKEVLKDEYGIYH